MEKKKCYSPQSERGLVRLLYLEAKTRRVLMTRLANELMRAALTAARSRRAR